jgi:hypothetical protein
MEYTRKALLDEIMNFSKTTGWKVTNIGVETMGDRNFVQSLREGRLPRRETFIKVRQWMSENA